MRKIIVKVQKFVIYMIRINESHDLIILHKHGEIFLFN